MKTKKLTTEEHVQQAEELKRCIESIENIARTMSFRHGKTCRSVLRLRSALDRLYRAKAALDDEYHAVTSNDNFIKYGHVYYGQRSQA